MRTRFLMLKPSRPKTAGFHGLLWDFRAGKCLVKVLYICVYWASVLERGKFYSKSKKKSLSPQSPTILALGVYYTCILRFIIISHSFLKPSADQNSISHSQKKGWGGSTNSDKFGTLAQSSKSQHPRCLEISAHRLSFKST